MMGTPSNALQAGIYTRLTNTAALTSLIGSNKVFDFVPETATAPYVLIGDDTSINWDTKSNNGWEATLTIHVWDYEKQGRKSVKAVMSAIYDALHLQQANITVSGFTLVLIRWEYGETFQDTSVAGQSDNFYHGVQRYRALLHA
jgi:hypothetical protein